MISRRLICVLFMFKSSVENRYPQLNLCLKRTVVSYDTWASTAFYKIKCSTGIHLILWIFFIHGTIFYSKSNTFSDVSHKWCPILNILALKVCMCSKVKLYKVYIFNFRFDVDGSLNLMAKCRKYFTQIFTQIFTLVTPLVTFTQIYIQSLRLIQLAHLSDVSVVYIPSFLCE